MYNIYEIITYLISFNDIIKFLKMRFHSLFSFSTKLDTIKSFVISVRLLYLYSIYLIQHIKHLKNSNKSQDKFEFENDSETYKVIMLLSSNIYSVLIHLSDINIYINNSH